MRPLPLPASPSPSPSTRTLSRTLSLALALALTLTRHAADARAKDLAHLLTPQVRAAFAQADPGGDGALAAREVRPSSLYLPCISPISPLHLPNPAQPYISPISPPYLPTSPLHLPDPAQVRIGLRALSLPESAVDAALASLHKYDADGDGRLELGEFGLMASHLTKEQAEQAEI